MKIRKFKLSDTEEIGKLVVKVFSKYNKKEGSKKAVEAYLKKFRDVNKLKSKFKNPSIFFVAEDKEKIIGYIKGNKNRIGNLYILGKYHKKGIGKKLMNKFEKEAEKKKSKFIKVNSSLYAVSFYEKLGYKKTTGIRTLKKLFGLRYQPMKKELK